MQVFIPCAVYSLNAKEHNGAWQARHRIVKIIRHAAKIAGRDALNKGELRAFGDTRVQIIVKPFECRNQLTDAGNCVGSAKAAIDGLRDAGVIVDDAPRYVMAITYLAGEKVSSRDYEGLSVTFREWTE